MRIDRAVIRGITLLLAIASTAGVLRAQTAAQRVYDDAKVIRRIAEVAGREIPREIIDRIAAEDVDLLRGRRADGTYEFAHYEMDEASRKSQDFTVGSEGRLSSVLLSDSFVFRLVIESQSRRFVVKRNPRSFIDKVELETTAMDGTVKSETIPVGLWLDPGARKTIDFPAVMRKAKAIVYAKTEDKSGPSSLDVSLIEARVVDNFDSPYFAAVQNAKMVRDNVRKGDAKNFVTLANMLESSLTRSLEVAAAAPAPAPAQVSLVPAATPAAPPQPAASVRGTAPGREEMERTPDVEIYLELQAIEDLLTGTDPERREGMDRLHQLARKLRPTH